MKLKGLYFAISKKNYNWYSCKWCLRTLPFSIYSKWNSKDTLISSLSSRCIGSIRVSIILPALVLLWGASAPIWPPTELKNLLSLSSADSSPAPGPFLICSVFQSVFIIRLVCHRFLFVIFFTLIPNSQPLPSLFLSCSSCSVIHYRLAFYQSVMHIS